MEKERHKQKAPSLQFPKHMWITKLITKSERPFCSPGDESFSSSQLVLSGPWCSWQQPRLLQAPTQRAPMLERRSQPAGPATQTRDGHRTAVERGRNGQLDMKAGQGESAGSTRCTGWRPRRARSSDEETPGALTSGTANVALGFVSGETRGGQGQQSWSVLANPTEEVYFPGV